MKKSIAIFTLLLMLTVPAFAASTKEPPGGSYKKVSELVAPPDFLPGMETLYVKPCTLPVGPFLAYDREGTLVATIYIVPLKDFEQHKAITGLEIGESNVAQVNITFNARHPGVEVPHYHVTVG